MQKRGFSCIKKRILIKILALGDLSRIVRAKCRGRRPSYADHVRQDEESGGRFLGGALIVAILPTHAALFLVDADIVVCQRLTLFD
jgi:hypothetical protein